LSVNACLQCLEKQREIDRLREENTRLKQQLRYRQRQAAQGPFGSSTPSAQLPVKANTAEEGRAKRGGAPFGHVGHGRQAIDADTADRVETVAVGSRCPDCGGTLEAKGFRGRTVFDSQATQTERRLYRLEKKYCPRCRKAVEARAPGVLPKALVGNQRLTQVAFWHYRDGIPLGRLSEQTQIGLGTLIQSLHRLARLFQPVVPQLIEQYRQALVRHADETSWRTDGHSGYAWLFATPQLSLFLFRPTRSASVAKEVLGDQPLAGVLVVDRYSGYNRAPCALQYCYAHLLREVEELGQEFPEQPEVRRFTASLIPLLAQAMHLQAQPLSDHAYHQQARRLRQQIGGVVGQPAQHLGVRRIQDLLSEQAHRLYHWAEDRRVPADNNRAERELRPTVIARKVSFGSQSDAGAKTREVLMSVVHTLKKRSADPEHHFKSVLDQLAADPSQDPVDLLFPFDSS
jgi:transposase